MSTTESIRSIDTSTSTKVRGTTPWLNVGRSLDELTCLVSSGTMASTPSGAESSLLTPDGTRLVTYVRNAHVTDKPTLIFLHHWGGSPRLFEPLLRESGIASHPTVTYHARGWSPSTGPDDASKYGVPEMASDLEQVIASTVTPKGVVLIAHSMAGKVAQYYVATRSGPQRERVKGLVLVAPAPLWSIFTPPEIKEQSRAAYYDAVMAEGGIRGVITARPDSLDDATVKLLVEDAMRGSKHAIDQWPEYGSSCDYAHLETQVPGPVLVLRGDKDFQKDYVGLLGMDKGWSNITVPDCGHMMHLEQTNVLGEHIKAFVERVKG